MVVDRTAAYGTRNAPSYIDSSSPAYSNRSTISPQSTVQNRHASLPIRKPVGQHSASSSRDHPSNHPSSVTSPSTDGATSNLAHGAVSNPSRKSITSSTDSSSSISAAPAQSGTSKNHHTTKSIDEDDAPFQDAVDHYEGKPLLVQGASEAPSLEGIVNLNDSARTIIHEKIEPGESSIDVLCLINS